MANYFLTWKPFHAAHHMTKGMCQKQELYKVSYLCYMTNFDFSALYKNTLHFHLVKYYLVMQGAGQNDIRGYLTSVHMAC